MSIADTLLTNLADLGGRAIEELRAARSIAELQEIKTKYLGKKGLVSEVLKSLREVGDADRPRVGARANELRNQLESTCAESGEKLENIEIERELQTEKIDITLPGSRIAVGAIHPLVQVRNRLLRIFADLGFAQTTGPEIDTEFCNFEALNVPPNHPARDMQDTLYVSPGVVLRTHTSSMQTRAMLVQAAPVKVVMTGAVYRNDAVDATHSPMFHQIEGLYVDSNVNMGHLKGTLEAFVRNLFGANTKIRFRPSFFPFTEPSVEVDCSCAFCSGKGCRICKFSGWIEILGAGMVNPAVLEQVGYDPKQVNGFAFGLGIERVAMLFYDVDDIRLFYENDLRFLEQFTV